MGKQWNAVVLALVLTAGSSVGRAASSIADEPNAAGAQAGLRLSFELPHWLYIDGTHLPGGRIQINYMEAYCRPGSTDADWDRETVIPHEVTMVRLSPDGKQLELLDRLADGVTANHLITAGTDEVDFRITLHNPTTTPSNAHWAQACVRLGPFTGYDDASSPNLDDYLPKCFVFLSGQLARMDQIRPWATEARYVPGQVWGAPGVPASDLNPRPHSSLQVDLGLIGAFSSDERMIFATAWDPYQELFQGVARCLHSDLRIGGLEPGQTKSARGKIYLLPNDPSALLDRHKKDFSHP
jgi:hypothetical protein